MFAIYVSVLIKYRHPFDMGQDIVSSALLVSKLENDYQERNMRNAAKTIASYLSIESEK
jgi:hypothetical protein